MQIQNHHCGTISEIICYLFIKDLICLKFPILFLNVCLSELCPSFNYVAGVYYNKLVLLLIISCATYFFGLFQNQF